MPKERRRQNERKREIEGYTHNKRYACVPVSNSCSSHRYQFSKFIALDEEILVATATQENSQDLPLNVVKLIIGTSQFLREVCSVLQVDDGDGNGGDGSGSSDGGGNSGSNGGCCCGGGDSDSDGSSDGGDEAVVTVMVAAAAAAAMVALAVIITPLHVITLSDMRVQRVKKNWLRKKCLFYLVQPMCITLNDKFKFSFVQALVCKIKTKIRNRSNR